METFIIVVSKISDICRIFPFPKAHYFIFLKHEILFTQDLKNLKKFKKPFYLSPTLNIFYRPLFLGPDGRMSSNLSTSVFISAIKLQ